MPLKPLDNILIVVDDLEAAKAFFIALACGSRTSRRSEGLSSLA